MNKVFLIFVVLIFVVINGYLVFLYLNLPEETQRPEETQEKEEEQEPEEVFNIIVSNPKEGEEVGLPLNVEGEARVFEGTVNLRLKEKDGIVLVEDITIAQSPDIGQFGPFAKELNYPLPNTAEGILEVFQISAKDGSEIDKVVIPLKFKQVESSTIKVFFGNIIEDPRYLHCEKVYSTERRIPKISAIARATLKELLKGPTITEQNQGFFTTINPGVKIQGLTIENGVAKVDFDEQLEFQVGGSCRVTAIRSQITETLKQFLTVNSVVISINGRAEDILQP